MYTMIRRLAIGALILLAVFWASGGITSAATHSDSPAEAAGEAGKKTAEEGAAKLNPIDFKHWDLSIWTAVVFVVVLLILGKFAWKPIADGLQLRENEIANQIAEAQRKNEEARQLLADYEKKLAAAQDEVRALIEHGRRDAEKVGQQLLDKAREEAGIERQRAVQQIESATSAALKEVAERTASLAVELAGKIVGAQLKAADHRRLIEQAVSEFARSGQGKVNGTSHN
jgi:F-type H+-transporting ATPase subunit b